MSRMKAALLLLLFLLGTVSACSPATSDETIVRIDAETVTDRLSGKSAANTILLDSRSLEEFDAGHLPTAVNLRLEDLASGRTTGLSRYSTIIVYGQNPGSATATALAKRLISLGYGGVRLFEGGVDAWRSAGLPLERTDPSPLRVAPE